MNRTGLCIILLALTGSAASAGTFVPAPILEERGLQTLNRQVTREWVDRDLFSDPYSTTVIGNVDVYDVFPYLEARYFQVVSDAGWNRLLFGEIDGTLREFRGDGTPFGALREPRGIASDASGRVYVADAGNHRVLVFETRSEYGSLDLVPAYAIEGLSHPYDIAHSDRGTPFDRNDDALFVADTGANRIAAFELGDRDARFVSAIGSLGSGPGAFAGPTSIAVGRHDGVNTHDIYVGDAHTGRIVRLTENGGQLAWVGAQVLEGGLATSLDVDHYGNVYAAQPQAGHIVKLTADLVPLASTQEGVERPRAFHIPFVTRSDHRDGTQRWTGQGAGLVVEEWNDHAGIRLLRLGVELKDFAATGDGQIRATFTATDHAHVIAEVFAKGSDTYLARREFDVTTGPGDVTFPGDDGAAFLSDGDYVLRVRAQSLSSGEITQQEASVPLRGSQVEAPARAVLLANAPNPFSSLTTISFAVPAGAPKNVNVGVYDVTGRNVRVLQDGALAPGVHHCTWDGRDSEGRAVSAGVYLYRYQIAGEVLTRKMVLMR